MPESDSSGTEKLITVAVTLVAGLIARQVVTIGWRAIRGTAPIKDDDTPLGEIIIFTAVSAAAVAAAKAWAAQQAHHRTSSA
jgi:hypothetical protein